MGCDIHIVVERHVGDKWVGIDATNYFAISRHSKDDPRHAFPVCRDRNYERFAKLAGVRGEGPAPLGLPDDISDLTRLEVDRWGVDGHSHSWLSLREAAQVWLETEWRAPGVPLDPKSYEAMYPESHYFNCENGDFADYRIVFWFDN